MFYMFYGWQTYEYCIKVILTFTSRATYILKPVQSIKYTRIIMKGASGFIYFKVM